MTARQALASAAAARSAAMRVAINEPAAAPAQPFVRQEPKLGRNDPCHCGSGKKFKNCHGKLT